MKVRLVIVGLTLGLFGFYTQASAQITATLPLNYVSKTISAVDTVTLGSVMPYQVSGDVNFHALRKQGLFDLSNFNWSLTGGTAGTNYELRDQNGAASAPAAKDTTISVKWLIAGPYKVIVREVPVPTAGPAITCNADDEEMDVLVVARPTLAFPSANTGGCSVAGTTVNIPVNVTGTGQYEVTYKIDYTPLTGAGSNKVPTGTKVTIGSYQPGAQSLNLTYAITAGEYGVYTVTVENLSDRISRKSGVATLAADIPGSTFKIYSYPAPNTNPITHIRNL